MESTIKGRLSELSLLQDPSFGIPSDVTFKIVRKRINNNDILEDREVLGEIKGHKIILATLSSVFKSMFFGPLKEEKDVVQVEETTFEAFEKLIEYIYQSDIDCSSLTLLELYDIVNLAEMYDMPKLIAQIKMQMEKIPLSMDNLIDVAHTAGQFTQFEDVSSALLLACSKFLQNDIRNPADQLQFALDQLGNGRGETALQLLALAKDLPPPNCNNCSMEKCIDGELVDGHDKFTAGLKLKVNKNCGVYWGRNGGQFAEKRYICASMFNTDQVTVKDRDTGITITAQNYNIKWNVNGLMIFTFCYDCS